MPNSNYLDTLEDDQPGPLALTVVEAARLARSSRSKIYETLKGRTLEGKKLGRRTIILMEDLEKYLSSLPNFKGDLPETDDE